MDLLHRQCMSDVVYKSRSRAGHQRDNVLGVGPLSLLTGIDIFDGDKAYEDLK